MDWTALHADAFTGRRVLVTGAAGFIGSHLVHALTELGAEVVALDDLTAGDWANLTGFDADVTKITASILEYGALAEAIAGCDCVFHQAALGSVPKSVEQPERFYEVNVTGTLRVLEAARQAGVRRVLFAASSSAYGDPPHADAPKVENQPPLPMSPYAATKLAGEHTVRAWAHSYGLDGAALRYFNIFGPRQSADSDYAAVIAAFAKSLSRGEAGTIFGDGEQSRDFTHVANAVHANLLAARHPEPLRGEVFNVACGQRISVNELHRQMAKQWDQPNLSPTHKPARPGDVRHSLADVSRIHETLGYEPIVDFPTGLAETVEWYRRQFAESG